jgi:hypothetical protein
MVPQELATQITRFVGRIGGMEENRDELPPENFTLASALIGWLARLAIRLVYLLVFSVVAYVVAYAVMRLVG